MEPDEWTQRYETRNTRWDLGRSPSVLLAWLRELQSPLKVLIPGCGRGYEVADFLRGGHDVTAIDYSEGAIHAARDVLGDDAEVILSGDFFQVSLPEAAFDICYERTFLTSLSMDQREGYSHRIASLLKPSGLLVGIFHYAPEIDPDGPPYPITLKERDRLFSPYFTLAHDEPCPSGLEVFAGHDERWQIWERRS